MSGVSVRLDATLTVDATSDSTSCLDGTGYPDTYKPNLLATNQAFPYGAEAGQKGMAIDSTGALVALAVPATLRGRVFYFRPIAGTFTLIELTHATAGAVEYPVGGLVLLEVAEAEQISAVRVQGVGRFEWALVGVLV